MKKDILTLEKAKNTPAGGVLVGKREGQTIIHDKGTQGGYFVGRLHKENGIKGINKTTGQPIEVQGGEVIITAPAVADQTKREFEGQMLTNREILSKINEKGGGVSFEQGGEIYYNGSSYNYGGKTMTDYEIMQEISNCGCKHGGLSEGKSLQDIADIHNVSLPVVKKELAKGKKIESEHTSDKKLAEKIAKDHLVENPKYYTLLKKAKLKKGGKIDLVEESEKGDHTARDLNNYNDLIDVQADDIVGAETGLTFANGGDLDFLDDAVKKFDDGGSVTNEVEAIELSQGSATYWGTMPKTQYNSFNEFLSDLQTAFINKEKRGGYFYFWVLKDGMRINSVKLAIQFKNGKNTVLNLNPLTAKSSDFLKQIERRYINTIKRNNLDFSKWLGGKSTPKPQPKPEPKKEIATSIITEVFFGGKLVDSSSNKYIFSVKKFLDDVFNIRGVVKVKLSLANQDGKNIISSEYIYLDKSNHDIFNFNILSFNDFDFERLFANIFPLDNLDGISEFEPPIAFSQQELDFILKRVKPQPEPKKEEVKIDFEATKKYLNMRIADLSKELNFKRPRLSNEEIGFYQRDINNLIERLRMLIEKQLDTLPLRLRLDDAFSLKWGNINAEYQPAQDLLAPNGLPTKLTEEEYLNVRTPYFSSFFGDWQLANETGDFSGVSKVLDPETKEPMPVYHGTNVLFTEWKTYKTNNAHYFAKNRDFSQWFAEQWSKGRGDISAKDSNLIKQLNPNKGEYLYRCFLDIKNPIDFSRFGVEKRPVSDFLMFLQINYNIGDFDFWTNFRLFNNLTQDTLVYSWMIIRNWQSFTEYIKMATTYDGYIFYEYHPEKVGTGLDGASLSFCAFDSNQIKFTNATEFNALITDSRFEQGGKL